MVVALIGVVVGSAIISAILFYSGVYDWTQSTIYAIPISVISSAIMIPSIVNMKEKQREFLIYESAFSDIIGIMAFFLFISNVGERASKIAIDIGGNISLTLILSVVVSYIIIVVLQRLNTSVKFFLLMAMLCLIYATGKIYHLSPLLAILSFGLIINNRELFFKGFLKSLIIEEQYKDALSELKVMTGETAFLVRTFFFFIFGLTINLNSLVDFYVIFISILILIGIYGLRLGLFKVFVAKSNRKSMSWLAPRGLITILLFYSIPDEYIYEDFKSGILLFVIIASSLIMSLALMSRSKEENESEENELEDSDPVNDTLEEIPITHSLGNQESSEETDEYIS